MTYSEVVALLSSHMVQRDSESAVQIPLLEKFINLDNEDGINDDDFEAQFAQGDERDYEEMGEIDHDIEGMESIEHHQDYGHDHDQIMDD